VDSFEEAHTAGVRQIVVGDIRRIVGIPHGSQCNSSDANRPNANDGRRAHVMYQTVVTLVSTHFHENKIETPVVGTWVNPEIINKRTLRKQCRIRGYHSGADEELYVLEEYAVKSVETRQALQRDTSHTSSGPKSEPGKKPASRLAATCSSETFDVSQRTTWPHVPEDRTLGKKKNIELSL
jgi:hypothetical protein